MATTWTLVATGFSPGVPEAACVDLSKGTDVQLKLWMTPGAPLPGSNVIHAQVVEQMTAECSRGAGMTGRPGCAYTLNGKYMADIAKWIVENYGVATEEAALKHEVYHILASRFQSMNTHSTNTRSLMYAAWNPRQPPGFVAEDRRKLKNYY